MFPGFPDGFTAWISDMRNRFSALSWPGLTPFSSPEPRIFLTCGRDRELWLCPTPEVRDSRTARQIWQIWLADQNMKQYSAHAQKIGSGQSSRSLPQARSIMALGTRIVQLRKSAIHRLPVTLRMLRVKSDKSDWFWSQPIVFTKPFKTGMSLDLARGPDFSSAWQKGPVGMRLYLHSLPLWHGCIVHWWYWFHTMASTPPL